MSKNARQKIEDTCKSLGIKILELTYDPSITYVSGGWDIIVQFEGFEEEEVYGAHTADELINDLNSTVSNLS